MARERIVSSQDLAEDETPFSYALRPRRFADYIGQEKLLERLKIVVKAATSRNEPVDHILVHGPPGLGKTTLAHVIANEVGAQVHVVAGPALTRGADLSGILTRLAKGDVLFIDEIHRIPAVVEEMLYSAMEDYKIDVTGDVGMHARTMTLQLKPFTLIGATTRIGLLTGPMRSRFGIVEHIEFYTPQALHEILRQNRHLLNLEANSDALKEISTAVAAHRASPTVSSAASAISPPSNPPARSPSPSSSRPSSSKASTKKVWIARTRQFLKTLIEVYDGGPVGIDAIAATLGEERDTLEDVIEPYLLQMQPAMVTRTRQGRRATKPPMSTSV
jgi:Holliday junction DNA helicase RuvB